MFFWIHRQDTELRFVAKFGENQSLRSCRKVVWLPHKKYVGCAGLVLAPYFAQNGLISSKIPWMLSPLDLSTYTEFGPDRLCFAGLIPERLIFRTPEVNYRLSAYNDTMHYLASLW